MTAAAAAAAGSAGTAAMDGAPSAADPPGRPWPRADPLAAPRAPVQ